MQRNNVYYLVDLVRKDHLEAVRKAIDDLPDGTTSIQSIHFLTSFRWTLYLFQKI